MSVVSRSGAAPDRCAIRPVTPSEMNHSFMPIPSDGAGPDRSSGMT
jgi:hypothetical protein